MNDYSPKFICIPAVSLKKVNKGANNSEIKNSLLLSQFMYCSWVIVPESKFWEEISDLLLFNNNLSKLSFFTMIYGYSYLFYCLPKESYYRSYWLKLENRLYFFE